MFWPEPQESGARGGERQGEGERPEGPATMSERRLVANVRRRRPSVGDLMADKLTSLSAETIVEEALDAHQIQKVFTAISQGQDIACTISVKRSLCGELMPQRVLT